MSRALFLAHFRLRRSFPLGQIHFSVAVAAGAVVVGIGIGVVVGIGVDFGVGIVVGVGGFDGVGGCYLKTFLISLTQ